MNKIQNLFSEILTRQIVRENPIHGCKSGRYHRWCRKVFSLFLKNPGFVSEFFIRLAVQKTSQFKLPEELSDGYVGSCRLQAADRGGFVAPILDELRRAIPNWVLKLAVAEGTTLIVEKYLEDDLDTLAHLIDNG